VRIGAGLVGAVLGCALGLWTGAARAQPTALEELGAAAGEAAAPSELLDSLARFEERAVEARSERRRAPKPRLREGFLGVPIVQQEEEYSCGPAALLSVLQYWQVSKDSETALYPLLGTTEDGTKPEMLVAGAKKLGLEASMRSKLGLADLRAALARGETVILNIQAWRAKEDADKPWKDLWKNGHYVVLLAMDKHFAYVMDPGGGAEGQYGYIPLDELLERWHDVEERAGRREESLQLGIFIKGKTPSEPGKRVPRRELTRIQ
jgi:predicted double-glycine peptidase